MQWRTAYEAYMRYVRKNKPRRFYICAMRGIPLPCLAMRARAGIYSTNCTFTPSKARRRPYTLVRGLIHYIWDVDPRLHKVGEGSVVGERLSNLYVPTPMRSTFQRRTCLGDLQCHCILALPLPRNPHSTSPSPCSPTSHL